MSRPVEGLPHAASILARALRGDRLEWVSTRSWTLARELVASLRGDVAVALDNGPTNAAIVLAIGRGTLARWRREGWLAGGEP